MKEKRNDHTCINNGERKCLEYERKYYKLDVIKTIFTPRMVLSIGFVISLLLSAMKG